MSNPRKIRCRVERITDHGDRVFTVDLVPERPVPPFRPGHFLHLTLDEYDPSGFWPESRVFSIASSPTERSRLQVIYSVKGVYTSRMERELKAGGSVWVKLPYGEFEVNGATEAVLIAGGTGITAFQAFIEGLPPDGPAVVLLYGTRRPGLLLGRELIDEKVRTSKHFQAFYFSETEAAGGVHPGRVRLDVLKGCPISPAAIYYLAGPPPMLAAFRRELEAQGIPTTQIRVDAWE